MAEYDYIVVGGGTAGCVVAARLAADPEAQVLLIEAGPDGRGVSQITEPHLWPALRETSLDWGYGYAASPHVAGRRVGMISGRVLGGGSATGDLVWDRGHPDDYDAWERAGATGWNHETLLPYFRRAEDWEGGETARRGAGGPLRIERPKAPHPVATAFLAAASELGLKELDDANGGDGDGAALPNLTMTGGGTPAGGRVTGKRRHSVVDGYLASPPPNLTILTCSPVTRLGFTGDACTSVFHVLHGAVQETRARREVVVTLGAFGTPRLLMRSGIGDPAELARLGVPVVSAVPGVGQNLQDHPVLSGLNFRARHRTGLVRDNGGGAVATWRSTSAGGGAGTDAGAGGGAGAGAAGGRADLHAAVYQGRHVDMASGPGPRAGLGASADVFSIAAGLLAPRSTGYLRVLSVSDGAGGSDGLGGPGADDLEIQPNLLADSADVAALSEAVSFVMDLADTTAYRELIESPLADVPLPAGGTVSRAADLERFVRTHAGSLGDPCGTAAMGSAPSAGAVVDSSLKVFGVTGLRVADASVIPVIPRCGLRAPVVAIAERAADLISS